MLQTLSNFMRVRDIRNKILFTLGMLMIFRHGNIYPGAGCQYRCSKISRPVQRIRPIERFRRRRPSKLLHFCHGDHAVHYRIHHHAAFADGCRAEIHRMGETGRNGPAQIGAIYTVLHDRPRIYPGIRNVRTDLINLAGGLLITDPGVEHVFVNRFGIDNGYSLFDVAG